MERYINTNDEKNRPELYRNGARVKSDLTFLDAFNCEPWTSGYLQGIIDVPFISLTPGTRDGIIQDDKFQCATENIKRVEAELKKYIGMHKEAEEGKDNKNTMRTVKKTLLNAFADIPGEEYDWLDVYRKEKQKQAGNEKKNGINNNVCG